MVYKCHNKLPKWAKTIGSTEASISMKTTHIQAYKMKKSFKMKLKYRMYQ